MQSAYRNAVVAGAALAWMLSASLAAAQPGPPTNLHPGDRLTDHGAAVTVPPRGHGVTAHAIMVGGDQELSVQTTPEGKVIVSEWGDDSEVGDDLPSADPPACDDDAYNQKRYKFMATFQWKFNAGSTPSEVIADNAEDKIREAGGNITNPTGCGLADNISASISYTGRTSLGVQINNNATCQDDGNGTSSVGFGTLPQGTLGYSCVWDRLLGRPWWTAEEADVRLNSTEHQWVANLGPNCSGKWSIEGVMTHERGHSFGLGHVSEENHKWLTMSTKINGTCQNREATLGLGDVRGLEEKY